MTPREALARIEQVIVQRGEVMTCAADLEELRAAVEALEGPHLPMLILDELGLSEWDRSHPPLRCYRPDHLRAVDTAIRSALAAARSPDKERDDAT